MRATSPPTPMPGRTTSRPTWCVCALLVLWFCVIGSLPWDHGIDCVGWARNGAHNVYHGHIHAHSAPRPKAPPSTPPSSPPQAQAPMHCPARS